MPPSNTQSAPRVSESYVGVTTPHYAKPGANDDDFVSKNGLALGSSDDQPEPVSVNRILYSSVALVLLMVLQFGWSISQLNLSTFNSKDDCDARPVPEGKCLMFPGHSSGQWSVAVNGWAVGGMIGSLSSGAVADRLGRKRALMVNSLVVVLGSVIQASAQSVLMLAAGRFISGIASGANTSIPNSFINEIAPPHLRNKLGALYQCSVGVGILVQGFTFFFANTSSGWRFIAGFPVVLAVVFLLAAPKFMVESPSWLLTQGRREEAEIEIARLYGSQNVKRALEWMAVKDANEAAEEGLARPSTSQHGTDASESETTTQNPSKALFSKAYRMQTIVVVVICLAQQLSGINAVFFYSSSIFKDAGLSDDRIGMIVVDIANVLPSFFAGGLGTRFGNKNVLLAGHGIMLLSAVGITISLVATIAWLSIIFTALYVVGFAISLGPLVFVVASSLFPAHLRASGMALGLFANWIGTLVVGVGYPHVADALNDWGFTPFVVLLGLFALFIAKFLPETSGKTDEQVQEIFRARLKNPLTAASNSSVSAVPVLQ